MLKRNAKIIIDYAEFIHSFLEYKRQNNDTNRGFNLSWKDKLPCLRENSSTAGYDGHYIYHTSWAARILASNKPEFHVDFSSSLFFSTIVSAFIPIKFYDYRPAVIKLENLTSESRDLLNLSFKDNSLLSISCMHVVEHIGLSRYGDPLDPNGDLKAISELKRVLAIGGSLLFVVPIGEPKIIFNAHRIYSYNQIISYFHDFKLMEFSLIPDDYLIKGIIKNASREMADAQKYGCGCFWFIKN